MLLDNFIFGVALITINFVQKEVQKEETYIAHFKNCTPEKPSIGFEYVRPPQMQVKVCKA